MGHAIRDQNYNPVMLGVDSTDATTPLPLEVNSTTGRLLVDASVSQGTQYTEADTDSTITGTAVMWEDTADTIRAVSATYPLPVSISAALPAGTNAIGKLSANTGVDIGDVDVTSVVPGTGATNLGKAEDGAHSSGDTGVMMLGVRNDNITSLSGTDLDYTPIMTDGNGRLRVFQVDAIAAGTNTLGGVSIRPETSNGLSIFRSIDVDESEEAVKATAGQLYGWYIYNNSVSTVYVKFYNATVATVVVGTTTPTMTVPIPAGAGANVEFTNGITFSTAITIAATTGVADNDTGAPSANDIVANILYK